MTVLAIDLGTREGDQRARLRPVADVALVPVQLPRAVRLAHGARLHVVHVRAGVRLGEGERGELAAAGEVGQEALLLLVGAEQHDALHADRLVHAHDHAERRVDLRELLRHAAVARLRQPRRRRTRSARTAPSARARRAPRSCRRRSSAPPRSCAGRSPRRTRAPASRGGGCGPARPGPASGYGNTSSSWISPRKSDFENDETPCCGGASCLVVAASMSSRGPYTSSGERGPGPTYAAVGRIRRPSRFCSRMCADQPATRAQVNIGVKRSGGTLA